MSQGGHSSLFEPFPNGGEGSSFKEPEACSPFLSKDFNAFEALLTYINHFLVLMFVPMFVPKFDENPFVKNKGTIVVLLLCQSKLIGKE